MARSFPRFRARNEPPVRITNLAPVRAPKIQRVTEGLARAHAYDAGQRSMRAAKRKTWNDADQAAHDAALARILPLVGSPIEVLFS